MALATYSDLQTAVASWLGRPGDTVITSNVADFITLAEARIAYGSEHPQFQSEPLKIRAMEVSAEIVIGTPVLNSTVGGTANAITLTPTTAITSYTNGLLYKMIATFSNTGATTLNVSAVGATSVVKGSARSALSANDIILGGTYNFYYDGINAVWVLMPDEADAPLPANYLSMRSFYIILSANENRPLEYMPPDLFNTTHINQTSGRPQVYTIEGDAIRIGPVPDATYYAPLLYYQKFPALSGTNNWLMTNAPSVYLHGSLLEACIFLGDDDGAGRYFAQYIGSCNSLQSQDERDRHPGKIFIRNDLGNP